MNKRRSERVLLQVRVMVETQIGNGTLARLDAYTLVVNAHGGMMEMTLRPAQGQKLFLSNPATGSKEPARVVSVKRSHGGAFAVAFEFDNATPQFWPINFPPVDWEVVRSKIG
jgi:hypothetical protein